MNNTIRKIQMLCIGFMGLWLVGCASKPMPVKNINLEKFMGSWYVISHIPVWGEKNAYNAIENYSLNDKGQVDVKYTFNDKNLDGPDKKYTMTGFVNEKESGHWKVQPMWPFKFDYRVVYIDDNYKLTVIARKSRDYAWIMSRTPTLSDVEYSKATAALSELGYDLGALRLVPQAQAQKR